MLARRIIDSPVGALTLAASEGALVAVLWARDAEDGVRADRVRLEPMGDAPGHAVLDETARQLDAYFAGRLRSFSLPLEFRGTDFQKQVWQALTMIPFGETRSYGEIARAIDRPDAVRAVGAANGRNPISIVAPCHRVIGADGSLTGFGGGLPAKRYLLDLESAPRLL